MSRADESMAIIDEYCEELEMINDGWPQLELIFFITTAAVAFALIFAAALLTQCFTACCRLQSCGDNGCSTGFVSCCKSLVFCCGCGWCERVTLNCRVVSDM